MATLVLAGAGAALGGSIGGGVLGLSTAVLGKAAGAAVGSMLDQRLLGVGAAPIEAGRVERFRVMGSGEGAAVPRVFGRMRVAGQIIWSSRFLEQVSSEDVGGKGGGGSQRVDRYSYSISLAVALCEGEVQRVGRIWADGQPVEQASLTWRLHTGSDDQLPDPLIAAIEGIDATPAYRGTAYVVFENLELAPYGNRIPQFSFEVFRRPRTAGLPVARPPVEDICGVALVPGTGEYALATEPVFMSRGRGETRAVNVHNDQGRPDFLVSLDQLAEEAPSARAVSLVVSWFGDDLRCGRCTLRPKVEQTQEDGDPIRWSVSGLGRGAALPVSRIDGRPLFGGTPADSTVVQAIRHMRARGQDVMFYPFILMDILSGNGLINPWSGGAEQPPVPWRGRITLDRAPAVSGSSDKTPAAADEVAAFFGSARPSDFEISDGAVRYTGSAGWSYRHFILHYAHLCALAGGVEAFCIGSEMRSLTQIRESADSYPAVRELCDLATDVRAILGPDTKIGYAADWSEYFGHQPQDGSNDVLFHLDPLWSHPDIDFIGIDNYMPLSDWRDEADHLDDQAGSIYSLEYLTCNVAGGEGYDWFYATPDDRTSQKRTSIQDGAHGEDWVFRYKDIANWWARRHHNRIGGVRSPESTSWEPRSKPIRFTELGCPAVDKGTNQPNVFHDPKSSESFFPYFSSGRRDDFIQYRYLQAMFRHWTDPAANPLSDLYGGRMVDMQRAYVWAWDARPWPDFPARTETWIDGANYSRGHWLNGRISQPALAEVVAEICDRAGLRSLELDRLHGSTAGYQVADIETARQSLQPLMLTYGFDSFSAGDQLAFATRDAMVPVVVVADELALDAGEPVVTATRAPDAEVAGRVVFGFVRADGEYAAGAVEALAPDLAEPHTAESAASIVMHEEEARAVADRWLHESRVARETLVCALPPSRLTITCGDHLVLEHPGRSDVYRLDHVEELGRRAIRAVRVEKAVYVPVSTGGAGASVPRRALAAPAPVHVEFLDLPLLTGDESPVSPHIAVSKVPWTGPVDVYASPEDHGYTLKAQLRRPATVGELMEPLPAALPGVWMPGGLRVRITSGSLQSRTASDVLNGANAAAIRSGREGDWEIIQFERADLIVPQEYHLRRLLRGQAGTDAVMPEVWPAGSDFVLLDAAVQQVPLQPSSRGLARHYRVGPASRAYSDAAYTHLVAVCEGVGLRPYKPAHLDARRDAGGDITITWIRRTRIDGDSWQGLDVPLGEERESYLVRVHAADMLIREIVVGHPHVTYTAAAQTADAAAGPLAFEVAQLSDRFGPGPFGRIVLDA